MPAVELVRVAAGGHLGAVQGDVFGRADPQIELDQRPAVERGAQLVGTVRGAEPGPQHEVGIARHGVGRIVLQHTEALHRLDHPARPVDVEQLRAHGDPARLLAGELVCRHTGSSISWS